MSDIGFLPMNEVGWSRLWTASYESATQSASPGESEGSTVSTFASHSRVAALLRSPVLPATVTRSLADPATSFISEKSTGGSWTLKVERFPFSVFR